MPVLLEDPFTHLIERLTKTTSRWMVALAGVPGSGKSTLANRLAEQVNSHSGAGTMVALSMDGFHLPKAALAQFPDPAEAFARRGAPWTFDPAGLIERLQLVRIAAGTIAVPWPDFQHDIGDPVEGGLMVPPAAQVVLVEGLYLLHNDHDWQPVADLFDECWFLDTPLDLALDRLARRHMAAWGWDRAAAEHRIATNDRINAELVQASRDQADWLVR
ncbi:MAG: nucleoside/nucleotide kinase family protein [Roseiflexaceae bacterium]